MNTTPIVFGIGNPLVDVIISATDDDLRALDLDKGIMHLVTGPGRRLRLLLGHASVVLSSAGSWITSRVSRRLSCQDQARTGP
jgi:hypothetical protein